MRNSATHDTDATAVILLGERDPGTGCRSQVARDPPRLTAPDLFW